MQNNPLLTTPLPNTLVLDAFFDGAAAGNGRVQDACSTPDGSRYHDPATQNTVTYGGGTLASKMPARHGGARGVVIPRATRWGRSAGWNPHNPPHQRVIVDPFLLGQALECDLGQVTKEKAALASRMAEQMVPDVDSIERARLRQSAYYHALGQLGAARPMTASYDTRASELGSAPGITKTPSSLRAETPSAPPEQFAKTASEALAVAAQAQTQVPVPSAPSPLAVIRPASFAPASSLPLPTYVAPPPPPSPLPPPPPSPPSSPPAAAGADLPPFRHERGASLLSAFRETATTAAVPALGAAPQCRVVFGLPEGDHEVWFHAAVRDGVTLALIYDDSYRGGHRYFPNPRDEPFAVEVEGEPAIYLVESTGMQYRFEGRTHYLLLIHREAVKDEVRRRA